MLNSHRIFFLYNIFPYPKKHTYFSMHWECPERGYEVKPHSQKQNVNG